MRIHLASAQNMFRLQRTVGQVQNSGLEQIIQQVNANYSSRRSRDTVELSPKALELLNTSSSSKAEADSGFHNFPGVV